jgi:hypothetical protein
MPPNGAGNGAGPAAGSAQMKRPPNPRPSGDWQSGQWTGAPDAKVKYSYTDGDSLDSIAKKLAGTPTGDPKFPNYLGSLTWKDITRLNYGTEIPSEVNFYLSAFNGCSTPAADGKNFLLGAGDAEPWLWIPVAGVAPVPVNVPKATPPKICLAAPASEFTKALLDIFDYVDADSSGFLSKNELWTAVSSPLVTGTYAASVLTAKSFLSQLEDVSNDEIGPETNGISRADLVAFDALRVASPTDSLVQNVLGTFDYHRDKLCHADHDLFVGAPVATSVMQGPVGDCWLLAALIGLANRDPTAIGRLVKPTPGYGNARFTVKFPSEDEQEVRRPTDGEILSLSMAKGNGLWLTVLEKGWGQIVFGSMMGLLSTSKITAVDQGRALGRGIELVTGHGTDVDELLLTTLATTRDKLDKAFASNKIVTAGINNDIIKDNRSGWPNAHAYAILGYDRAGDQIKVRNPWGDTGPAGTSVARVPYSMPLPDFMGIFSRLAYEE